MEIPTSIPVKKFSVKAEYDEADVVLMHEPSTELYYGVLHPHAALFDTYFNAPKAAQEHQKYRTLLENNGLEVVTVKETLLLGAVDIAGEPLEGEELSELKKFARSCVRINTHKEQGLSTEEITAQHTYLDVVFETMHPVDLVRTILLQPNLILKKTPTNTFVTADYNVNPVMNLYFSRDQMITTGKGVVLTNLNSPQREIETKILALCLKKLGVKPVLELRKINKKAFLEGGDFFMLGQVAIVGTGMRTNQLAIDELLAADAFGTETLVVVEDTYHYQPQMHLDTYFNIIDKDLVAISASRWYAQPTDPQFLKIKIYKKVEGVVKIVETNLSFKAYLLTVLKLKVIVVNDDDQKSYALNFLCIAPRKIIAVAGQSQDFTDQLIAHNVAVQWVDFTNLKQGWGAAHCTTQVINRR